MKYFITCENGSLLEVDDREFKVCLDRHKHFRTEIDYDERVGEITEYFEPIKTSSGYRRDVFAYCIKS